MKLMINGKEWKWDKEEEKVLQGKRYVDPKKQQLN